LHRSPETALTDSTSSEPISYRRLFASATISFSRTPGRRASAMSAYVPSTMAAAVDSRAISSLDLSCLASSITCWPSLMSICCFCSSKKVGTSAKSTPTGSFLTPACVRRSWISATCLAVSPDAGGAAPRIVV
jgi:hypothetical protein